MEHRQLGKTDLHLSVVGFGASPFGDVFNETDRSERNAAVAYAVDQDINYFDVSPYYGLTLAEKRLGEALQGIRDKVILSTKCGRYGPDEFDFSASRITSGFEESLRRLRTDYVDILFAHDVEFGHVGQVVEETIPTLRQLQKEGKARYVGITGYSPRNLMRIASRTGVDCILNYCRYNLMVQDMADELIPFAQKHGIGLINASALHMGLLTNQGPPEWHPAPVAVLEAGRRVAAICKARCTDIAEVGLAFGLSQSHVASTLVGIASCEQVDACIRALNSHCEVSLLEEIRQVIDPVFNQTWPSGLMENHD